jgi:hypothetical protein
MKIALFIVRYKETDRLYQCLNSIGNNENVNTFIINNYDILVLPEEYNNKNIKVLNNMTRPDFSTGHLSRNWNEAIVNGFKDLSNPDCDRVVAIQADVILSNSWYNSVVSLNPEIYYLACGRGDEFQIFTKEGIKRIGLYDERFCNIGHQEADYFIRNFIGIPDNCCIMDPGHGRLYNKFSNVNNGQFIVASRGGLPNEDHINSQKYHEVSNTWFKTKWDKPHWRDNWSIYDKNLPSKIHYETMLYPYFEKDIDPELYVIYPRSKDTL